METEQALITPGGWMKRFKIGDRKCESHHLELHHIPPGRLADLQSDGWSLELLTPDRKTTQVVLSRLSHIRHQWPKLVNSLLLTFVMSPWIWVTPGRGAIACRSTATIFTCSACSFCPPSSFRLRTWLQLPGAAHRSTALFTPDRHQSIIKEKDGFQTILWELT